MSIQAHYEVVRHICAEPTETETVFPETKLRLFENFDLAESEVYVSVNHPILGIPKVASFVFISGNKCIRFKFEAFVDRFLTGFYEVLFHEFGESGVEER